MKNNFTTINLFSCPIYKIRVDPDLYDKEKIINDILYNKNLKNTRNESEHNFGNCVIHHSYDDHDNVDFRSINYDKLSNVYTEIFGEFFSKELVTIKPFNWKFDIVNYSAVTEGQWLPAHNHLWRVDSDHNDFATVHYLNFNKKDHSLTRFTNPSNFGQFLQFFHPELCDVLFSGEPESSYLWGSWSLQVEEDDIIIFPAALNHEIPSQKPTEEPRITISTNIKIV